MRFNVCQECGSKLRHVAIFCAKCGQPSCCWRCHKQHQAQHDVQAAAPAPEGDAGAASLAAESSNAAGAS